MKSNQHQGIPLSTRQSEPNSRHSGLFNLCILQFLSNIWLQDWVGICSAGRITYFQTSNMRENTRKTFLPIIQETANYADLRKLTLDGEIQKSRNKTSPGFFWSVKFALVVFESLRTYNHPINSTRSWSGQVGPTSSSVPRDVIRRPSWRPPSCSR